MYALVLEPHEQRPHRVVLIYNQAFTILAFQTGMIHDYINDGIVDILSIFIDFANRRPEHIIFVHIIPKHFVDADLKDGLEVGVDGFGEYACDAEFVDIKAWRVAVVEYLGMTESVDWWPIQILMCVMCPLDSICHT